VLKLNEQEKQMSSSNLVPSARQLRYLRSLALQAGSTFAVPRTRRDASREIDRLLSLRDQDDFLLIRESSIVSDPVVYATAADSGEVAGYGSSARWHTTPEREPETIPQSSDPHKSSVGVPTELARYSVSSGERAVYGQRINGHVRITDRSVTGDGRAYVIEREVERDGYEALQALVADYIEQAGVLDCVPMASSGVRDELERATVAT
jgi:hypothetical protein